MSVGLRLREVRIQRAGGRVAAVQEICRGLLFDGSFPWSRARRVYKSENENNKLAIW